MAVSRWGISSGGAETRHTEDISFVESVGGKNWNGVNTGWLASVDRGGDVGRRTGYAEVGLSACTVNVSKTSYHGMTAGTDGIEPHRKEGKHTQQPAPNLMRSS
jgi:hypothetical protein